MMEWWSSDQPVYSYMCWERVYNCDKCIFVRTSLSCRWCNNVCRSVYSTTLPYWCTLRIWWVSVCDLSMSIIDWQQSASHIVTVARSSLLLINITSTIIYHVTCVVVIFIAVMPLQSGRDFVFSMSGQTGSGSPPLGCHCGKFLKITYKILHSWQLCANDHLCKSAVKLVNSV